jgi:hypothetical protein
MLRFSDGIQINTSGEPRILNLKDGLYVTGKGVLIPVDSMDEALLVLERLEGAHE